MRGDTRHYEHVADECARGLMQVSLEYALPVANGVLAVEAHAARRKRAPAARMATRARKPRWRRWKWPALLHDLQRSTER